MVQRQQTQAQFLIGRLDEPLKGVIRSRDGQGGAAAQPGLRDHELSSSGPGRGLAAVSGQVGLVSGLAGKVSGRGRGLSRGGSGGGPREAGPEAAGAGARGAGPEGAMRRGGGL